ncbi:MAG: hypothetical protein KAR19_10950 [Bacteroidales bacterium]|nr:hypothetical protein [Bacteroidales bacterium]
MVHILSSRWFLPGCSFDIKKLQRALHSDQPELIAVYGHRRVGKTYLVRDLFDDRICSAAHAIDDLLFVNGAPLGEE